LGFNYTNSESTANLSSSSQEPQTQNPSLGNQPSSEDNNLTNPRQSDSNENQSSVDSSQSSQSYESSQSSSNSSNSEPGDTNYRIGLAEFIEYTENKKAESLKNLENNISESEFKKDYQEAISKNQQSKANSGYNKYFYQAYITPEGGVLDTTIVGAKIKLTFPQGVVTEDIIVTYKAGSQFEYTDDNKTLIKNQLGQVYSLTAENLYGQKVNKFNTELTLETYLTDQDLTSEDISPETYYYNEESKQWVSIPSSFDNTGKVVVSKTDHFTNFTTSAADPDNAESDGVCATDSFGN
jgi:hypothetical protein